MNNKYQLTEIEQIIFEKDFKQKKQKLDNLQVQIYQNNEFIDLEVKKCWSEWQIQRDKVNKIYKKNYQEIVISSQISALYHSIFKTIMIRAWDQDVKKINQDYQRQIDQLNNQKRIFCCYCKEELDEIEEIGDKKLKFNLQNFVLVGGCNEHRQSKRQSSKKRTKYVYAVQFDQNIKEVINVLEKVNKIERIQQMKETKFSKEELKTLQQLADIQQILVASMKSLDCLYKNVGLAKFKNIMTNYYKNVIYQYKKLNQKVEKYFNNIMELFKSKLHGTSYSILSWKYHQNPAEIGQLVYAIMKDLQAKFGQLQKDKQNTKENVKKFYESIKSFLKDELKEKIEEKIKEINSSYQRLCISQKRSQILSDKNQGVISEKINLKKILRQQLKYFYQKDIGYKTIEQNLKYFFANYTHESVWMLLDHASFNYEMKMGKHMLKLSNGIYVNNFQLTMMQLSGSLALDEDFNNIKKTLLHKPNRSFGALSYLKSLINQLKLMAAFYNKNKRIMEEFKYLGNIFIQKVEEKFYIDQIKHNTSKKQNQKYIKNSLTNKILKLIEGKFISSNICDDIFESPDETALFSIDYSNNVIENSEKRTDFFFIQPETLFKEANLLRKNDKFYQWFRYLYFSFNVEKSDLFTQTISKFQNEKDQAVCVQKTIVHQGQNIKSLKVGGKVLIENLDYENPEALKYNLISTLEDEKKRFIITRNEHEEREQLNEYQKMVKHLKDFRERSFPTPRESRQSLRTSRIS